MFGLILVAISQSFAEIGTSLGKKEVALKHESFFAMGFLNAVWATVVFVAMGIFSGADFTIAFASLPTLGLRIILEVILMFVSLSAVLAADRSTFSFLRTLTIPLLVVADLSLGYAVSTQQIFGIALIVIAFLFLFTNHGLSRRGKMLSLFSGLLAVATITLYKYDIAHYNSVNAEQSIVYIVMLAAMLAASKYYGHENVFASLLKPRLFVQSVIAGIATVPLSYAYLYAPASIITAAKRAFEILGAIISGKTYFREKHLIIKLMAFVLIVVGVGLTVM